MYDARARAYLSRCLADAFLAGVWNERAAAERAARALERRPRWLVPIVREVLAAYHRPPADAPRELARFIELAMRDRGTPAGDPGPPRVRRWLVPAPAMGRRRWPVPVITTLAELAALLDLTDNQLAWIADVRGLERSVPDERLRHYRYSARPRANGSVRVIESPKTRLKAIQRQILRDILDQVPAHDVAHGFVRGRSVNTNAGAHTGRFVVIRLDLEDFFASVTASRVYGIFRTAGYPESVAHCLTALTTNVVSATAWSAIPAPADPRQIGTHFRLGRRLATPHLPQGAPTSPALANLAAFRLDRRLAGLAAAFESGYTRYADDLTFSGSASLVGVAPALRRAVGEIALEEGFVVNDSKSMLATRAGCQRVCGVVVNEGTNVPRREYETLKAILHNATVHGPASQNNAELGDFRAHLQGRVSWVESLNPNRGEKLRRKLAAITWPIVP